MDKRIYICAAIILVFTVLAFLVYNNLEIYQEKTYTSPLREVQNNNYHALERWLKETGHPVRVDNNLNPENISLIPEKAAIVNAPACEWDNAAEYLIPWIEKGNSLVICLSYYSTEDIDENLYDFLLDLGIEAETSPSSTEYHGENIPSFRWRIHFNTDEDIFTINDNQGLARLAEISLGEGTLSVTGFPAFMYNYNLGNEINSRLAWELTGERAEDAGVLFVRTRQITKSFFGKLMERGNLIPVVISALLVIFLGFWMVIPVFGLVFEEKQKNSRPIRERFAAEISFLKKYRGLGYYLEPNNRELNKNYNYRDLINKLRSVYDGTDKLKR
jgi:hypothetical protein